MVCWWVCKWGFNGGHWVCGWVCRWSGCVFGAGLLPGSIGGGGWGTPKTWTFWTQKVDFLNLTPLTLLQTIFAHFVAKSGPFAGKFGEGVHRTLQPPTPGYGPGLGFVWMGEWVLDKGHSLYGIIHCKHEYSVLNSIWANERSLNKPLFNFWSKKHGFSLWVTEHNFKGPLGDEWPEKGGLKGGLHVTFGHFCFVT